MRCFLLLLVYSNILMLLVIFDHHISYISKFFLNYHVPNYHNGTYIRVFHHSIQLEIFLISLLGFLLDWLFYFLFLLLFHHDHDLSTLFYLFFLVIYSLLFHHLLHFSLNLVLLNSSYVHTLHL